ncbi:MAG: PHP domain-containing protein [Desulfovibrionaceae bacterium]
MIDLHTHSTASDGSCSPTELVELAHRARLSAVALTDHDTMGGLAEAKAAGARLGIEVIPGCELSVGEGKRSMHIVGLWLPEHPGALQARLDFVLEARASRNAKIVAKLRDLGIDITLAEIEAEAQGTVGRPHFAKVLVRKGAANSIQDAFDRLVGNDGKAYVPRVRLTPEEGIRLLSGEGAMPVLAHPYLYALSDADLDETVARFKSYGLEAIEAYYTEHSQAQTAFYKALAERHGLLVSGGSDFHGDPKPWCKIGIGRGSLRVPDAVLDAMKAHRRSRGQWV